MRVGDRHVLISRTPFRLSLGGGGTDLPSYYRQHGGFFISAAIDRYIYVSLSPSFDKNTLRVSYSTTEIVSGAHEVSHGAVREALRLLGIEGGLEIVSVAGAPASAGLGSSASFSVGLLTGLHSYLHQEVPRRELAEEACHIAMDLLHEPSGKQDEYAATFGGISTYEVARDGTVEIHPLELSDDTLAELQASILMFYTGITRSSSSVLSKQQKAIINGDATQRMHQIKELGFQSRDALMKGDLARFGELMSDHWVVKRGVVDEMTAAPIDHWISKALSNGASGAKLVGAGGGGFLMTFCTKGRSKLRQAMAEEGLVEHRFNFDFEGTKVIYNV